MPKPFFLHSHFKRNIFSLLTRSAVTFVYLSDLLKKPTDSMLISKSMQFVCLLRNFIEKESISRNLVTINRYQKLFFLTYLLTLLCFSLSTFPASLCLHTRKSLSSLSDRETTNK